MQAFMPPDAFTFETSGQLVMQTAIGGAGTLFGPLVGAARLAFSAATSCRPRCISARPGSWCSAWCSCCWSASCVAGSSAASRISISLRSAHGKSRAGRGSADGGSSQRKMAECCSRRRRAPPAIAAMPARHREADRDQRADPAGQGAHQALRRPRRQQRHRFRRQSRRTARHHRPERRRQDPPSSRC